MPRYRLAAEKLQRVQMHVRERLMIRRDGGLQQAFPKAATLWPSRLQMSCRLDRDAIDLGRPQLSDGGGNGGCHAEDQIERPRHRATDRPSIHQYLANERHRTVGIGQVCPFCRQWIRTSLARPLPPIGALKVQVDQDHRTAPARSHARASTWAQSAERVSSSWVFSAAKSATQRVFNWRIAPKALSPGQRCGTIVGRKIFFFFRMVDSSP
jgi:hypothetical protein